jgi:hypothetical protein
MISAHTIRSNHSIFIPVDTGSPRDGVMAHIAQLGQMARLDFERCSVAGEVIFAIEGDAAPVAQADEDARIGTLAYALKKLGNVEDAAEFTRCLNAICADGDARSRQIIASHYYGEISARGVSVVLKEMALLAMQLAAMTAKQEGDDDGLDCSAADWSETFSIANTVDEDEPENIRAWFEMEVAAIARMTRGHKHSACFLHNAEAEWLGDLELNGASMEELDAAFLHLEAQEQYDEGGAILLMSSHERTVACGRLDPELSAEDLPERAQHLASQLRRDYASGIRLEEIWDDVNAQLEILFPVSGRTETHAKFYSHANRELQQFSRQVLEAILCDCEQDFHLTALRRNRKYREFHKAIRGASDTRIISELMKQAYEARQQRSLPLKHFTTLKTAAQLQRERLNSARLSRPAFQLLKEVNAASSSRLRFLAWACYGSNQPSHPIHSLPAQEQARIWEAIRARKAPVARAQAA